VSPSAVHSSPQNTAYRNTLPYRQKKAVQGRELARIALIQIGSGYSGEGDKDIRSSWDLNVCVYHSFE